uniref:Uncharacterized protein n=1 Tax=Glossina pallidipes TaxID=7398 RepID=A0A1A9ZHP9_GLOPL
SSIIKLPRQCKLGVVLVDDLEFNPISLFSLSFLIQNHGIHILLKSNVVYVPIRLLYILNIISCSLELLLQIGYRQSLTVRSFIYQ